MGGCGLVGIPGKGGRKNEEEIDSGMVSRRLLGGDSGKKVV